MEFISLVFRLGVVLAIFSFIWGLLQFGFTLLRGGTPLPYPVALVLKGIQYFLIADITVLFCANKGNGDALPLDLVLSGLILLMYFIGKVQNMKNRFMIVQFQARQLNRPIQKPDMRWEFSVVGLSMALFVVLSLYPQFAINDAANWFYRNITEIEKAPIFGFIFKIVGFFFTLSILFRMITAFSVLLSGKPFDRNDNDRNGGNDDTYRFDDYEEVK
jgi:hypothetical protein